MHLIDVFLLDIQRISVLGILHLWGLQLNDKYTCDICF